MATGKSFLAPVGKRITAEFVDFVVIGLAAAFVGQIIEEREKIFGDSIYGIYYLVAIVYVAYHATFLTAWRGQTPGKFIMDIQVFPVSGQALSPWRYFLRPMSRMVMCMAAFAATQKSAGGMLVALPVAIEIMLLKGTVDRRTLADMICGTMVVSSPPVQPHRAPSGPMYSETDAEFGYRPRDAKQK